MSNSDAKCASQTCLHPQWQGEFRTRSGVPSFGALIGHLCAPPILAASMNQSDPRWSARTIRGIHVNNLRIASSKNRPSVARSLRRAGVWHALDGNPSWACSHPNYGPKIYFPKRGLKSEISRSGRETRTFFLTALPVQSGHNSDSRMTQPMRTAGATTAGS